MKMKPRFLQLKARLELATEKELFTEFMKRVVTKGNIAPCYFIDTTFDGGWEIHRAGEHPMIFTKEEE